MPLSPELGSHSLSRRHYDVSDTLHSIHFKYGRTSLPETREPRLTFVDLPPEIRNMIYHLALVKEPYQPQFALGDVPYWFTKEEETRQMNDWLPPSLSNTNKQIRQESMPVYYRNNSFDFYWQPNRPHCYLRPELRREQSEGALQKFMRGLEFFQKHDLQLGKVVFRNQGMWDPYMWIPECLSPVIDFIQIFSPLLRSHVYSVEEKEFSYQGQPGHPFPVVRELDCRGRGLHSVRMLLKFSKSIRPHKLHNRLHIEARLWGYACNSEHMSRLLCDIESLEDDAACVDEWRKGQEREKAKKQGIERWGKVLRSRITKEEEETAAWEKEEHWNGRLRSRKSQGVGE